MNIAGMKIEGVDTDTSKILPEVVEVLKKCSRDVCVAGGAVLGAVTLKPWGCASTTSDIDYWLTVKNDESSVLDVDTIISTTDSSSRAWSHHVFYGRDSSGRSINIVNFKKNNLEEILSSFDNPASQVGIRVAGDGRVELLCSEDFIETMKTGLISWWNFASGSPARLVKYHCKGFKLAPHLEEIRTLKSYFLSECPLPRVVGVKSEEFVKNSGDDVRYESHIPKYRLEDLYKGSEIYCDLHTAENVSTCGDTLLVTFDAPITKMLVAFFEKSLLPKIKVDSVSGSSPTWKNKGDQLVLCRDNKPSRIILPKAQKHVVLSPDTLLVFSGSSMKYKDFSDPSCFKFENYKVRVFGRLEYHIIGDAYESYVKPTFVALL